ncbi:MAG: tetrahydromethanopterin S-methyltransferase subunit A [Deltaproteobacteria bacterium]|nr:tetrahydromethanopterin S-methyltransferase subunit A [Deltaproteobacteria bacterium]
MNEGKSKGEILKVKLSKDYPPEEGCYLRGNDFSPVAVVVMLNYAREQTPPEIEQLVRAAIEKGAALAGTLQTENIGIEKIVTNIVANPNIRYLVLCGTEVAGHNTGDALRCLLENGIDERRTIIGSNALTPYLFNIPIKSIKQFRKQLTLINLLNEMDPNAAANAVWSCYQEEPTKFQNYILHDPGAYPQPAICSNITWRIKKPQEIEDWEIDDILKNRR